MSEYTEQAEQFIAKHELEFRAVLIGNDCPTFCKDAEENRDMDKVTVFPRRTHIHGKHYRCTFSRKEKDHFAVDFWNSYADEQTNWVVDQRIQPWNYNQLPLVLVNLAKAAGNKHVKVQAYDVLACITKSDPGTFDDFCSEFGYDTDSRKAEQVYYAVVKEWRNVQRFFTADELTELQEIN